MSRSPDSAPDLRAWLGDWERSLQTSRWGPSLRRLRAEHLEARLARALRRRRGSALASEVLYRTLIGRAPHRHETAALRRQVSAGSNFGEILAELEQCPEARSWAMARGATALRGTLRERLTDGHPIGGPRLVFLHIMKVGGSSLSDMVRQLVPQERVRMHVFLDDLVLLPPQMLSQMSLIGGHIPFEALPLIPGPYETLTVLRDPYARTLSHFSHLREVREAHRDLTLEQFVFDDDFSVLSGNYQARQLVHEIDLPGAWHTYSPPERCHEAGGDPEDAYPLQSLFDSAPLAISDPDLAERAQQTLATIDHVGVTEQLDQTANAIARLFGAAPRPLPRLNTSSPIDPSEIDGRIRRRIDAQTAVDRHLYEIAAERAA